MTIVKRATRDMFDYESTANIMVNPVNLQGAMGAGLAAEFKRRFPQMYAEYKEACRTQKLKIGKIMVYHGKEAKYDIVNLATKNHWVDDADLELIRLGLGALQRYLIRPEHQYAHVVMPMLGCGLGNMNYATVEPSFYEYLDGLDAVISLCMHPDKLGYTPTYLGIIGPRCWADITAIGKPDPSSGEIYTEQRYQEERRYVEDALHEAMGLWHLQPSGFDAFVSGGARGVDTVACGTSRTDPSFDQSLAKAYSKAPPVICYADWNKYGNAAGMIRNRLVVDICTHLVVIRPPGVTAIGTTAAARLVQNWNRDHPPGDPLHKHLYIKGEADLSAKPKIIDIATESRDRLSF